MNYDAFISYSHSDCGNIAPAIQKAIENIGKPWYKIKRNLTVFRDETNLAASPDLWQSIEDALSNSDNFILLASPQTAKSFWINKEIENWLTNHYTSEKGITNLFIIGTHEKIIWDNETHDFDWDKTTSLPEILKGKFKAEPYFANLSDYVNKNDLAIDFKSVGFTSNLVKIVAGILNKAPREIESAELKRNRNVKRVVIFTFLLLISLLIFSLRQRRIAIEQKNIAIVETKKAVSNLEKYKIEEFERNYKNGNIYFEANEYCLAKKAFLSANSTSKDTLFNKSINPLKIKYIDSIITVCYKLDQNCK